MSLGLIFGRPEGRPLRSALPSLTAFLSVACVVRVAWLLVTAAGRVSADAADVARAQQMAELVDRYAQVRAYLPRGIAVGYIVAAPPDSIVFAERYAAARYAVAPAILQSSGDLPVVVADFFDEASLRRYVDRVGGRLVAHPDVGLGVVERTSPVR